MIYKYFILLSTISSEETKNFLYYKILFQIRFISHLATIDSIILKTLDLH